MPFWRGSIRSVFIFVLLFCSQSVLAQQLPFPLIVNGQLLGDVRVTPSEDAEQVSVLIQDLIQVGGSQLIPAKKAQLEELARLNSSLKIRDLNAQGFNLKFDVNKLQLSWGQSPEEMSSQDFIKSKNEGLALRLDPEPWSLIFNARASQNIYSPDTANKSFRDPILGDHDFALRFKKLVFEGYFKTFENSRSVYRQDFRAVYDRPDLSTRWSLGDLQYGVLGYQVFRPLLGLGMQKDPAISWDPLTQVLSGQEIVLNRFSLVEIYINGSLYRSQRLGPGRFSIADLPLVAGLNQVQILVTDENGETQKVEFPYLSEQSLLSKGEQRYSLNAGRLGFDQSNTGREYYKNSGYSFYHRWGLHETFTSGVWAQGDDGQNIAGLEGTLGTRWGLFSAEGARSYLRNDKAQFAGRLRYRSFTNKNLWQSSLGLSLENRELRFSTWGVSNPYERYEWQRDCFISFSPWFGHRLTVGALQADDRMGIKNKNQNYAVYSLSPIKNGQLSFEYSERKDATINENRLFVYFNWFEPKKNLQVYSSYVEKDRETRAQISWEPSRKESPWSARAGVASKASSTVANAETSYRSSSFVAGVSGEWKDSSLDLAKRSGAYRWNVGSAIVVMPGAWTLSRPVTDSILLVKLDETQASKDVTVSAVGDLLEEDSVRRNQLVLPELASYRRFEMGVQLGGGSLFTSLANDRFTLYPTYRSAMKIALETRGTLVARARLIDRRQRPVDLIAGRLLNVRGDEQAVFFTDKQGRLYLEGIKPGKYSLELETNGSLQKIEIEIPELKFGEVDLGTFVTKEGL